MFATIIGSGTETPVDAHAKAVLRVFSLPQLSPVFPLASFICLSVEGLEVCRQSGVSFDYYTQISDGFRVRLCGAV